MVRQKAQLCAKISALLALAGAAGSARAATCMSDIWNSIYEAPTSVSEVYSSLSAEDQGYLQNSLIPQVDRFKKEFNALYSAWSKNRTRGKNADEIAERLAEIASGLWTTDFVDASAYESIISRSPPDLAKLSAFLSSMDAESRKIFRKMTGSSESIGDLRKKLGLNPTEEIKIQAKDGTTYDISVEHPLTAPGDHDIPKITLLPKTWIKKAATVLEQKLTARDPWEFTPEQETKFALAANDTGVPENERLRNLYDAMIEARLENTNPASRWLMRSAIEDAIKQRSIYRHTFGRLFGTIAGPHYNPIFNRVYIPKKINPGIKELLIAFHEAEHAFHRNTSVMPLITMPFTAKEIYMFLSTPIGPIARFRMESRAVGAQWEFVRRIPVERRLVLIKELKKQLGEFERSRKISNVMEKSFTEITLRSLENADLSKDDFLARVAPTHSYSAENLLFSKYKIGPWRLYLLVTSATGMYEAIANQSDPNEVTSPDVRALTKLYLHLFANEPANPADSTNSSASPNIPSDEPQYNE